MHASEKWNIKAKVCPAYTDYPSEYISYNIKHPSFKPLLNKRRQLFHHLYHFLGNKTEPWFCSLNYPTFLSTTNSFKILSFLYWPYVLLQDPLVEVYTFPSIIYIACKLHTSTQSDNMMFWWFCSDYKYYSNVLILAIYLFKFILYPLRLYQIRLTSPKEKLILICIWYASMLELELLEFWNWLSYQKLLARKEKVKNFRFFTLTRYPAVFLRLEKCG